MNTALIESRPSVMMDKPVVAGTRITVESLLERLAAGETGEQFEISRYAPLRRGF